jgi:hypothetical protein
MYSVAYHYAKDLDSDVVVTSRRPTLIAYYSELFEINFWDVSCFVSGRPGVSIILIMRSGTLVIWFRSTDPTKARHPLG